MRPTQPGSDVALRDRASRDFRPSGGITAGVRSTRDFHPRHLPSLAFLRPSTVYSSKRFACLVSYRHHLWDSKNMSGRYLLAFLTGLPWGQSRPGLQAGHAHNPEGLPARFRREKQRKPGTRWRVYPTRPNVSASLTAQTASRLNGRRAHQPAWRSRLMASCALRTNSRNVTHQNNRKRLLWEEGTSTSTKKRTDHGYRPLLPTTTAPLPERHLEQATPKNRLLCRSHHNSRHASKTQLKRPIGIASRPSFQAIERSML